MRQRRMAVIGMSRPKAVAGSARDRGVFAGRGSDNVIARMWVTALTGGRVKRI